MFNPYDEAIDTPAFVFAYTARKPDGDNRIYAIAAAVVLADGRRRTFSTPVRYAHLSARERQVSGLTAAELSNAPEIGDALQTLESFLEEVAVVFAFDPDGQIEKLPFRKTALRMVDLSFAVEFFFPGLDSYSPSVLWERIRGKKRKRIRFSAEEMVDLSIEVVRHICTTVLNDGTHSPAAALRFYLSASRTLFGKSFVHVAERYTEYFGEMFSPVSRPDTPDWQQFLEPAVRSVEEDTPKEAIRPVSEGEVEALFEGMAGAGRSYHLRPAQIRYARHIVSALNGNAVLTIEAGTGTRKTQGYLVPLLAFLARNPDVRAVISTYTKSLQQQILHQEIAGTLSVFGHFSTIPVALLKGKGSYVCVEKLDHLYEKGATGAPMVAWLYLLILAYGFRTADLDSIGENVRRRLGTASNFFEMIQEVSARSGCTVRHRHCPAQVVTAEAFQARLVVTNHAKLATLDADPVLAGRYSRWIIDEANHFEKAVRNAAGLDIFSRDILATVGFLSGHADRIRRAAGKHPPRELAEALEASETLKTLMNGFGRLLATLHARRANGETHLLPSPDEERSHPEVEEHLLEIPHAMTHLCKGFEWVKNPVTCSDLHVDRRTAQRLHSAVNRLSEAAETFRIISETRPGKTHVTAYRNHWRWWTIEHRPVDVSGWIRENLLETQDAVVFTAATITDKNRFGPFCRLLGIPEPHDDGSLAESGSTGAYCFAIIPSPYSDNDVRVLVPEEAVNGSYKNKAAWLDTVTDAIPRLIAENHGRTLVLFSSYEDLEAVAGQVADRIDRMQIPLLIQQKGQPTANLCEEFRSVTESVLFGVDTFWYGVDFKGDTLTQVIITRIPYPSPSDPILQARKKIMDPRDYWRLYAYETQIKLRQGMGRLIRSETDSGRVVVLDTRFKPS